jgi:hypothetical protein
MPSSLLQFHVTLHPSHPSPPMPTSTNIIATSSVPLSLQLHFLNPFGPSHPTRRSCTPTLILLFQFHFSPYPLIVTILSVINSPLSKPPIDVSKAGHIKSSIECHVIHHPCLAHPHFEHLYLGIT